MNSVDQDVLPFKPHGTNRLIVDGREFDVNSSYQAGALACRFGRSVADCVDLNDQDAASWHAGFRNENAYLHVVAGVDVITHSGGGAFLVPTPSEPDKAPRRSKLKYAHRLMKATTIFADARAILSENRLLSLTALTRLLNQNGHTLTTELSGLAIARIALESRIDGDVLNADEEDAVARSSPAVRHFLTTLARIELSYYDATARTHALSATLGKRENYSFSLLRNMEGFGLGFTVQYSRRYCALTAKGWAAVKGWMPNLSCAPDQIGQRLAAPSIPVEDDQPEVSTEMRM